MRVEAPAPPPALAEEIVAEAPAAAETAPPVADVESAEAPPAPAESPPPPARASHAHVYAPGFAGLGLNQPVLRALADMGFEEPSPIQAQTIPIVMSGRDVIGQAQTGTGKTAAFGVPIVEHIEVRQLRIQALVITPTRELCLQVAGEIAKIGRYRNVRTLPVYGGQSIDRQVRALTQGVHVVVGTPGRVMDHLRRGTMHLENVHLVVLDEADEMLDMGFIEDIEFILQAVPPEGRQTLLFSATMPDPILRLARRYLNEPERVTIASESLTVPQITQVFYEIRNHDRVEGLARILDYEDVERGIIFCRTKKGADELGEALQARGFLAETIHGDLNQAQRTRVMKRFREGAVELLVATDVAARGLDIDNVTHVVNYEIPQDAESYVHRIGRTGRAGKAGEAITLIHPREFRQLRQIERAVRTRLERREVPSLADLAERQREAMRDDLRAAVSEGDLADYRSLVDDLLEDLDPVDIAAAALKLLARRDRDRDTREESVDFGDTGAEPGMVRLFINVGRAQRVGPADVVRTIAAETGIAGSVIGMIDIYDRFTFVEVPKDVASKVLHAMERATINGRMINVEPAKPRM
jgi:ATP-dependent RNA helicase DeaD